MPQWVGTNQSDYADFYGTKVFQEMKAIVDAEGSGALIYYFKKPETNEAEEKIGFVREFPAWGWIVGTGSYVSDIKAQLAHLRRLGMIANGASLVLLLLVSTFLARSVTRPMGQMNARMQGLAEGDTDTPVPYTAAHSEIGAMARALLECAGGDDHPGEGQKRIDQRHIEIDPAPARQRHQHQRRDRNHGQPVEGHDPIQRARAPQEAQPRQHQPKAERKARDQQHLSHRSPPDISLSPQRSPAWPQPGRWSRPRPNGHKASAPRARPRACRASA